MSPRIVYSTDPDLRDACPRCGHTPCVCNAIDLPARQQVAYVKLDRKRRAGKTVTVVYGLQHSPAAFRDLLKTLKTTCGETPGVGIQSETGGWIGKADRGFLCAHFLCYNSYRYPIFVVRKA